MTSNRCLVVIPARYASTRFPGKPLALIDGQPMIQHVWQNAQMLGHPVVVATDDLRISQTVEAFGGTVCMTSSSHPSGTDRVWEVAKQFPEADWLLNIQGDEPQILPTHLQPMLDDAFEQPERADIWTLVTRLTHSPDDPNRVKVVRAANGRGLYFSRSAVPYYRNQPAQPPAYWHHIGVYLYKRAALEAMVGWTVSPLEAAEQLEQLRALENGLALQTVEIDYAGFGIDTPEDLARLSKP